MAQGPERHMEQMKQAFRMDTFKSGNGSKQELANGTSNDATNSKKQRVHRITKDDIIMLFRKSSVFLLEKLNTTSFGFERFLKNREYRRQGKLDREIAPAIVEACSRACTVRRINNEGSVAKFLRMLSGCEDFLHKDALALANDCLAHPAGVDSAAIVKNYIVILRMLMRYDAGDASKISDYTYPALQNVVNTMQASRRTNVVNTMQASRRTNVVDVVEEYSKLRKEVEKFERRFVVEEDDVEVSGFRQTATFPSQNDVINVIVPDLPCNIVDAPYRSVDHYLSVHFRLMREDMIRSFRNCLDLCRNPDEVYKSGCQIYERVTPSFPPKFTPDGIQYDIHIESDKEIDISKTSTLLSGNLVCLSSDDFRRSLFFATLSGNPTASKQNKKECVTRIVLEEHSRHVLDPGVKYFMIETNAYYESYRHVLRALQEFDKNNFLLADIIVKFDAEFEAPQYLECPEEDDVTEYCLHEDPKCFQSRMLLDKLKRSNEDDDRDSTPIEVHCDCKKFKPLDSDRWPSASELELDDQQVLAFQAALTKKVTVIQGPPGTGKTHLGVKIVKALLENARRVPIVICCLTNHALDQFLERILERIPTDRVVRLGSQSKSSILKPHTMDSLLMAVRFNDDKNKLKDKDFRKSLMYVEKYAPHLLGNTTKEYDEMYQALKRTCFELGENYLLLDYCQNKYLDDSALNAIIDSDYKQQLVERSVTHSKNLSTSVMEWLGYNNTNRLYHECKVRFARFKSEYCGYLLPCDHFCVRKLHHDDPEHSGYKCMLPCDKRIDKEPCTRWCYQECKAGNTHPVDKTRKLDLWNLDCTARFTKFYEWRRNSIKCVERAIEFTLKIYDEFKNKYEGRIADADKVDLLQSALVIGVTTTGAAKFRNIIGLTYPKILVVEEAAEVLESHIVSAMSRTTEHLILIGDHKQLRPIPADHELAEVYNLKISMFERLFNNDAPSATLVSQHRMKPCIADLLVQKELYQELKSYHNVYQYEDVTCVKSSVFFLDHRHEESQTLSSTSICNEYEAKMVAGLAVYLCSQFYSASQLTILAAYAAQVVLIQEHMKAADLEVKVTTVDNYQGEENDVILVSFVRNNDRKAMGFLSENNRVCVAISRARKGMFCFGNFTMYAEKSALWKAVVEKLEAQKMIGPKMPLVCTRHGREVLVDQPEELQNFLRQGCVEKCGYVLPCGHVCVRKCHYDDADHSMYQCTQPCEMLVGEGKKCNRLCYQRCKTVKKIKTPMPCGHQTRQRKDGSVIQPCMEEVQKCLPCNHIDTLPCGTDVEWHKCKALVSVVLPCSHEKQVYCFRKDDLEHVVCTSKKPFRAPCGHMVEIPCTLSFEDNPEDPELFSFCTLSCSALLSCGHPCVGSCASCNDLGIHDMCAANCELVLSCGHRCRSKCGLPCLPCEEKCLMMCPHHKACINRCHRPCSIDCREKCERVCIHIGACKKKCSEPCTIAPCTEPCDEELNCGHLCIGLCGDPCPYLCRVCNADDLAPGDGKRTLYVELQDCNHVVDVVKLNEHIEDCFMGEDCLEWPNCPVCRKPIFHSMRYKSALFRARKSVLKGSDITAELEDVRYLLSSLWGVDGVVPAAFLDVSERIQEILYRPRPQSAMLFVLKHCIEALRDLVVIHEKLKQMAEEDNQVPEYSLHQQRFETLHNWIYNHLQVASYQQLNELEKQIYLFKRSFMR